MLRTEMKQQQKRKHSRWRLQYCERRNTNFCCNCFCFFFTRKYVLYSSAAWKYHRRKHLSTCETVNWICTFIRQTTTGFDLQARSLTIIPVTPRDALSTSRLSRLDDDIIIQPWRARVCPRVQRSRGFVPQHSIPLSLPQWNALTVTTPTPCRQQVYQTVYVCLIMTTDVLKQWLNRCFCFLTPTTERCKTA